MSQEMLWMIVIGCILGTFVWRLAGAIVVRYVDAKSALFEWVTCVSYAMVAGLVFRLIVMPQSDLALLPLWARLGSVAVAFAVYFLFRKSLVLGVLSGSLSLAATATLFV